jgi:hypothetical protein
MGVQITIIDGPEIEHAMECPCVWDGEAEAGCHWCEGSGTTHDILPEFMVDLANDNAIALFTVLGLPCDPQDLYGEVPAQEVADLRRRILRALNAPKSRARGFRDDEVLMSGPRAEPQEDGTIRLVQARPNWLSMGLDDEGIVDRLRRLDELLAKAQELGQGVRWS